MGFWDFLKKKELNEIQRLNNEIEKNNNFISTLLQRLEKLSVYDGILDAETEAQNIIASAKEKAQSIISEASIDAKKNA